MTDFNEFLAYERECRRLADQSKDGWTKKEFLSLADHWQKLAEGFEMQFHKSHPRKEQAH